MIEITDKINEIVKKVSSDENFANLFKQNPINAVEKVLGVDLPDETINKIIDGVKAKISVDTATSMLGKMADMFKK